MAPYLTLMREDAPQREHSLREVFNGLRWIIRTGSPWRYIPNDLPPWDIVYQQSQRWLKAGVFECDGAGSAGIIADGAWVGAARFIGGGDRLANAAEHAGKWRSRRLRRRQTEEGIKSAHGGGHIGTSADASRGVGGRAGSKRGGSRWSRISSGSRMTRWNWPAADLVAKHWRERLPRRRRRWNQAGSSQTTGAMRQTCGFVLLPRRCGWWSDRLAGWARFRRLARDYERLATTRWRGCTVWRSLV